MKVAEYRKAKGYTQKQMAEMLGIKVQGTYSKKERGLIAFKINELLLLEDILGVTIADMFKEKSK